LFGRAAPTTRDFCTGVGYAVEAQGFREQVCVLAQAVAGAFDVHDDRVVEQAVRKRRGDARDDFG
jgi:hypothetical protein